MELLGRVAFRAVLAAVGLGLLAYAYGPTLTAVAERWATHPQYSHGYLVPLFAVVLLWLRRGLLAGVDWRGSVWGLLLLTAGLSLHLAGTYRYYNWFAEASLLPALAGLALCLGGWPLLRWCWPAVAFLAFMLPLPYRVEVALAYPLQRLATLASAYLLQTVGFAAITEGAVIEMDSGVRLGVIEACNGLGMMVTFFALATGYAMLTKRPWLDTLILVASALPIALVANVVRITATGVAAQVSGPQLAELIFHDLAGWIMMPLAVVLLWLEQFVLDRLLMTPPAEEAPLAFDFGGPAMGTGPGPR